MPPSRTVRTTAVAPIESSRADADDGTSDPLAAVITLLRPRTVLSKGISGAGRWSVRYDAHLDPGFCVMLEGSCYLDVDGVGPVRLEEGDFVLLPSTPGFTMSSELGLAPRRIDAASTSELRHGDPSGPPTMRQLGGYFRVDRTNASLIVDLLPRMIHVRHDDPSASRLRSLVGLIGEEARACRPGKDLVLDRLVEVLLVEALRFRPTESDGSERGLLAGLADPPLARSIRRMHDDVAHRWTVGDLARTAGMSRASFAERFTRTVGVPPMTYLLGWRFALAKDLLRSRRIPLAEVAETIGYQSASAFSAAFSKHTGSAPSEFARLSRADGTAAPDA